LVHPKQPKRLSANHPQKLHLARRRQVRRFFLAQREQSYVYVLELGCVFRAPPNSLLKSGIPVKGSITLQAPARDGTFLLEASVLQEDHFVVKKKTALSLSPIWYSSFQKETGINTVRVLIDPALRELLNELSRDDTRS
jgi:hypothetical protein